MFSILQANIEKIAGKFSFPIQGVFYLSLILNPYYSKFIIYSIRKHMGDLQCIWCICFHWCFLIFKYVHLIFLFLVYKTDNLCKITTLHIKRKYYKLSRNQSVHNLQTFWFYVIFLGYNWFRYQYRIQTQHTEVYNDYVSPNKIGL